MLLSEFVKDKGVEKWYKSPLYIKYSLLSNYIKLVLEGEWIGNIKPIPEDFSTVPQIMLHFTLMPINTVPRFGDVYIICKPKRYRYGVYISDQYVIEQTSHLSPQHLGQHDDIFDEMTKARTRGYVVKLLRPINTKNISPADLVDYQKFIVDYFAQINNDTPQQDYIAPTYAQRVKFITALSLISSQAGLPFINIDIQTAQSLLDEFGYAVEKGQDSYNLRPYVVCYPKTPNSTRYNWGLYRFNVDSPFTTLTTAPHPYTDRNSELLATIVNANQAGQLCIIATCRRQINDYFRSGVKVTSSATGGTWRMTFRGVQSSPLPYNATVDQIQEALDAMANLPKGSTMTDLLNVNGTGGTLINIDTELRDEDNPTDTITVQNIDLVGGSVSVNHNADHARNSNAMFQWVIRAYQDGSATSNMQIHGFDDENRGVDVVLSPSRTIPSVFYKETLQTLRSHPYDVLARWDGGVQTLVFSNGTTGGSLTLTFQGQTTASIPYSTNTTTMAAAIQSALEALSNVGVRNVEVHYTNTNGITGSVVYVISFVNDTYDIYNEVAMTVNGGSLTGTSPSVTIHTGNNVQLAAVTNTQGDVAWRNNGQFIHVEIAEHIRLNDTELRELGTVLGSIQANTLSARSVPVITRNRFYPGQKVLSVGVSQAIGDDPRALPADHRHPWSDSDQIAGNNYIATRNSDNSGNLWRSPSQLRNLLGGYQVSDVDTKAYKLFTAPMATISTNSTARQNFGITLRAPSFPAVTIINGFEFYVSQTMVGADGTRYAVYQNNALIAQGTVDLSTTGLKTITFDTPLTLTSSNNVHIIIYGYGTPSQNAMLASTGNHAAVNGGLTGVNSRFWTTSDVLTATPPATYPTHTSAPEAFWLGIT